MVNLDRGDGSQKMDSLILMWRTPSRPLSEREYSSREIQRLKLRQKITVRVIDIPDPEPVVESAAPTAAEDDVSARRSRKRSPE